MIILVCGDRNWTDQETIKSVLDSLTAPGDVVIHGACRGADRLAGQAATALDLTVREYPAQWDTHGRAAGPIRNQQMLDLEHPDLVLAFHDRLTESKGTRDMIQRSRRAGITVRWFRHKGL